MHRIWRRRTVCIIEMSTVVWYFADMKRSRKTWTVDKKALCWVGSINTVERKLLMSIIYRPAWNLHQPNTPAYFLRDNPLLCPLFLHNNLLELGVNRILLNLCAAVFKSVIDLVDEHGAGLRRAMNHGDELRKKRIWNGRLWYDLIHASWPCHLWTQVHHSPDLRRSGRAGIAKPYAVLGCPEEAVSVVLSHFRKKGERVDRVMYKQNGDNSHDTNR